MMITWHEKLRYTHDFCIYVCMNASMLFYIAHRPLSPIPRLSKLQTWHGTSGLLRGCWVLACIPFPGSSPFWGSQYLLQHTKPIMRSTCDFPWLHERGNNVFGNKNTEEAFRLWRHGLFPEARRLAKAFPKLGTVSKWLLLMIWGACKDVHAMLFRWVKMYFEAQMKKNLGVGQTLHEINQNAQSGYLVARIIWTWHLIMKPATAKASQGQVYLCGD